MLEFLLLEKTASSILYNMAAGIYAFIARVYDIMLALSDRGADAGSIEKFYLNNITTAMYTIAGVFMLFRVTIAAINMIINPDMVNDSNKGAGKILVRIVTSLAMLILFVPNGWIFGEDGILMRIEKAVLAPNGLIDNISIKPLQSSADADAEESANPAVTDVSAAASKMECYYVYLTQSSEAVAQKNNDNGRTPKSDYSVTNMAHLTLYPDSDSGKTGKLCSNQYNIGIASYTNNCDYSYTSESGSQYTTHFEEENGKKIYWPKLKDGWPSKYDCPNVITGVGGGADSASDYASGTDWTKITAKFVGGWHTFEAMQKAVQASELPAASLNQDEIADSLGINVEGSRLGLNNVTAAAVDFAQGTFGTFINCAGDNCDSLKANMLIRPSADDEIIDGMADGSVTLDFFPSIIAGIGILIWVIVLCVDIIVRRLKLLLLQMIAPIPIISYSDPNDKMFDQWSKMYIATYLDLFLKLIAISFAVGLLSVVWAVLQQSSNGIETFFYVVAILVFAKMIPSMISKIFDIDNLGGSFKDIVGMGKSALGFGAGAAVGGAVGFASAKGIGNRLAGATKGALLGAGAGSKGNIFGGANSIRKDNMALNQANALGSTSGGRVRARMDSFFTGQDEYTRATADIEKKEAALIPQKQQLQRHSNVNSSVEALEKEIDKMAGYGVYDDAIRTHAKPGVWDHLVHSRNAKSELTQMESNMDQYLKSKGMDPSTITSDARSQMIAAKRAEVGKLKFDSDQEVRDFVFNKLATDENFDGKGVTRELYNSVKESLNDAGHGRVETYLDDGGNLGLKNINASELNQKLSIEREISKGEMEIQRAKEELDVSNAKASHDYINRNG